MVYSLTWLPDVLQREGLKISEVDGWRTRGHGDMDRVRGVICHHTGTATGGNMPSLNLLINGRTDLSGPLANLGLGRDGTFYIIAAGRAFHAGPGSWKGLTRGNSSFIGIEAENSGKANDAYPNVQMEAYYRGCAAILKFVESNASMVCGHREYALPKGRKIDPLFEMAPFREKVAAIMQGQAEPPHIIPLLDPQMRPTLRRGAKGATVDLVQRAVGVAVDSDFGARTEAAVRVFQRNQHAIDPQFVADGIVGPKTWAAIDRVLAGQAPVAAPMPLMAAAAAIPAIGQPQILAPVALPHEESPGHAASVNGSRAIGPDGIAFGRVEKSGFQSLGKTTLRKWLADPASQSAGLSPSELRAISAVSSNEGFFEAVNSYDDSFMSFGIMQWTAGNNGDGELGTMLQRLKTMFPDTFASCFGKYGLDCDSPPTAMYGPLLLDGRRLDSPASKAPLRSVAWAYRFWRAGHLADVRNAQIAHAAGRVQQFIGKSFAGFRVDQWFSSELAMAMLLDQHVNRPGQVLRVVKTAIASLPADLPKDPGLWGLAEEAKLIDRYLVARATRPLSTMTDSAKRALRIEGLADQGLLSKQRGSFKFQP
jgi:N-acetyl-anhydromuramyl-L-alanine amidase AmpD